MSSEQETDPIDDLLAAIAAFIGASLDTTRPRYKALRGLIESTVAELAEALTAETRGPGGRVSVVQVAELLYEYASGLWAADVAEALNDKGLVCEDDRAALTKWCEAKRAKERQQ